MERSHEAAASVTLLQHGLKAADEDEHPNDAAHNRVGSRHGELQVGATVTQMAAAKRLASMPHANSMGSR